MEIQKATPSDLDTILDIYAYARCFMAKTGNGTQWGNVWPPAELIEKDIAEGKSYVAKGGEKILAVFFYDYGKDVEPIYRLFHYGGPWMNDEPYGVVHRLAVAKEGTGVGKECIQWALDESGHLRVDTHENNAVMQHILKEMGFSYRGIIDIPEDTDTRMAFELIKDSPGNSL